MVVKSFLPKESAIKKHYSTYTDRDRSQNQNEVLAWWRIKGHAITIDGDRYSKVYHPLDAIALLIETLEDDGVGIPKHLQSWGGIQKWIKKQIYSYPTVFVPHLQAKRKWGKWSTTFAYEGRHGFNGMERGAVYNLMIKAYSEVFPD